MLWIPVERASAKPLIHQVYEHIRARILDGTLLGGEQLPSTRELAANLHISRNVVLEAYDQLLAEGYIEGRAGSGTYVVEGIHFETQRYSAMITRRDDWSCARFWPAISNARVASSANQSTS